MAEPDFRAQWRIRVNAKLAASVPPTGETGQVAAMFGLAERHAETLYDDFRLAIAPGQIVAVTGPSGAGKSVLLAAAGRQVPEAIWLRPASLGRCGRAAVNVLAGGTLRQRLEVLSRCGLAEARALVTPACRLSGGQAYRLALARALHAARRRSRPSLVLADEFGCVLDLPTAACLCRQVRRLIAGSRVALLLATPREELLAHLGPDVVVVKPLGGPPRLLPAARRRPRAPADLDPARWPIVRGSLADYHALGRFHYLGGPPAAHKRVYVIRRPRGPGSWAALAPHAAEPAAVLVVSPPLATVRGRNRATAGRYAGPDRAAALALLNREVECISRVVVHPVYRGCGLAVRLVRHALATARAPLVEALAAMGAVHPFFELAGMTPHAVGPDRHVARLKSAAEAVGLDGAALAAVGPVREMLARRTAAARFLRAEVDLCIRRLLAPSHRARLADPVAEVCRRTARQYIYYLAHRTEGTRR